MSSMVNNLQEHSGLQALFDLTQNRLQDVYSSYLKNIPSLELKDAMAYSLFNGGKRLRPLLIYATGYIFDAPLANLDIPASSVELIHTYSLIHDDLPCMDNADLRRGKPTSRKMYGEGMAVLTGDALHTLAMQIIASHPAPLSASKRVQMMSRLSFDCGAFGMAAGQALDITVMNEKNLSLETLVDIYRLKTGALFSACIALGYLAADKEDEFDQAALKTFGDCIGLAFQIQDDLLDIESSTDVLGKTQGTDLKNAKLTYPHLVSIAEAKKKVDVLYNTALSAINYLGPKADLLRVLTQYMLKRQQ